MGHHSDETPTGSMDLTDLLEVMSSDGEAILSLSDEEGPGGHRRAMSMDVLPLNETAASVSVPSPGPLPNTLAASSQDMDVADVHCWRTRDSSFLSEASDPAFPSPCSSEGDVVLLGDMLEQDPDLAEQTAKLAADLRRVTNCLEGVSIYQQTVHDLVLDGIADGGFFEPSDAELAHGAPEAIDRGIDVDGQTCLPNSHEGDAGTASAEGQGAILEGEPCRVLEEHPEEEPQAEESKQLSFEDATEEDCAG